MNFCDDGKQDQFDSGAVQSFMLVREFAEEMDLTLIVPLLK